MAVCPPLIDAVEGNLAGSAVVGGLRGKHDSALVFIAHGTLDEVLPIDATSGRRVSRLERDGYEVRYRKFDGGHEVPAEIAHEAVYWLVTE